MTRYYQVVLITMKDPAKFARYGGLVAPIVRRYGGARERLIRPDAIHADGIAKPDLVNVVYYDSKDAFVAFTADPAFREIVHLRTESIDMIALDGPPLAGDVSDGRDRLYTLEIAQYGAGGADGYAAYEREAAPLFDRFAYRTERVVGVDSADGFGFRPDVARVAYFETADGMARMHADPAHARVERELYPAAVTKSVWITGAAGD